MVTLSHFYLAAQTIVCGAFSYFMLFDAESFLKDNYQVTGLDSEVGLFALSMCKFWGGALFVFAFIYGHCLPFEQRHASAVRTGTLLDLVILAVCVYDAFFQPKNTPALKDAALQNVYMEGFFLVFGVITLLFGMPAKKKQE